MKRFIAIAVAMAVVVMVCVQVAAAGPGVMIGPDGQFQAGDGALTSTVTTTTSGAQPTSTCTPGYGYAGYYKGQIVGDGSQASANITWRGGTVNGSSGSHVIGWVGVQNDTVSHWIQAGLWDQPSTGMVKYIEYQTDAGYNWLPEGSFSQGVSYTALVRKNSAGSWTAQIGSTAKTVSISGMTNTQFNGESYMANFATCNFMNIDYSNASPWTTSNMSNDSTFPYAVTSVTSNGWKSSGG